MSDKINKHTHSTRKSLTASLWADFLFSSKPVNPLANVTYVLIDMIFYQGESADYQNQQTLEGGNHKQMCLVKEMKGYHTCSGFYSLDRTWAQ